MVLIDSDGGQHQVASQRLVEASDVLLRDRSDVPWSAQPLPLPAGSDGVGAPDPTVIAPPVPLLVGHYLVVEHIGSGGFGVVFRARDLDNGDDVALKFLRPEHRELGAAFKLESRSLAGIRHPGLLTADEIIQKDDHLVLAMPFVPGRDFGVAVRELAGDSGPIRAPERLTALLRNVGQALAALHDWGLVHMDLKPANIIVGADESVHILDFGLARPSGQHPTGEVWGTLRYLSPEQLEGEPLTHAVDLYALGLIVFESLAGSGPFDAALDPLGARATTTPPALSTLRPGVEPAWVELCARLLARSPEARGQSHWLATLGQVSASERHRAPPSFVGRDALLTTLTSAWDAVRAGGPSRIVHLSGPSGIGKTHLLRRFTHGLPDDTASLWGACFEREQVAYKGLDVIIDTLAERVARAPELAARRASSSDDLAATSRVFPALARALKAEPASASASDDDRGRAVAVLGHAIRALAPLVMIIDDAQWGDTDSADIVLSLLSTICRHGILLIVTSRGEDRGPSLLTSLEHAARRGLGPSMTRVAVEPLSDDEARALVAGAVDDTRLVDELLVRGEGNPFLLHLFSLWQGEATSSDSFQRAVDRVLAEVSEAQRALLLHVASCGRPMPLAVLTKAAGIGTPTRSDVARLAALGLVTAAFVSGRRALAIAHARLAEAILASTTQADRAHMHARLATVLIEADGDASAITEQLFASGDHQRAVQWAIAGAEAMVRASAFARAAELLRDALAAGAADTDAQLRVLRARALRASGDGMSAAELWSELASQATDGDQQSAHRRSAAESFLECGAIDRGLEALARDLDARALEPSTMGLVGGMLRLLIARGSVAERRTLDSVGARTADAQWIAAKGLMFTEPARGIGLILRGMRRSAEAGHELGVYRAKGALAGYVFSQIPGGGGIAARWLAEIRAAGEARDDRYLRGIGTLWGTLAHLVRGDITTALSVGRAALDELDGVPEAVWERSQAASFIARALTSQGDFERCAAVSSWYRREAERRDDHYGRMLFTGYGTLPLIASGELALARMRSDWLREAWLPRTYTVQRFYTTLYRVIAALYEGDVADAVRLTVADRKPFKGAGLHRIVFSRVDWDVMELRVALAATHGQRRGLRKPSDIARSLARESGADARAHGLLAAALLEQDGPEAVATRLVAARQQFTKAGIALEGAVIDLLLATHGSEAATAAQDELVRLGVANPRTWARIVAPNLEVRC